MHEIRAQVVSESPLVQELVDLDTAGQHSADTWSQSKFEENRSRIRKGLEDRLMHELVRPFRGSSSPEDLGLLEVTYPNLDRIAVPAKLLGVFGSESHGESIRSCWTDYLAALCDTLREQGEVTLGTDDRDMDYGADHIRHIGLWCSERDAFRTGCYVLLANARINGELHLHVPFSPLSFLSPTIVRSSMKCW